MRYILNCEGGDQLCGRAATGLPLTDSDFAVLPPHFAGPVVTPEEWDEILPGYATFFPGNFKPVLPFLVASLAYHLDFLRENLPANHLFRHSRLWLSNKLTVWKPHVLTGNGHNNASKLSATGIPPHVLLANELVKTKKELSEFRALILDKIEKLPEEVKIVMLDNFRIDGVVPLTPGQIHSMFSDLESRFIATVTAQHEAMQQNWHRHAAMIGAVVDPGGVLDIGANATGGYASFHWGGRFHPVPAGFRFPK